MSAQLNSWYDIDGRRGSGGRRGGRIDPLGNVKGLIGQIYFPTSRDRLDGQDTSVLDRLVRDVSRISRRERVELVMVGHADHRGTTEYNDRLAKKRANAVAMYVVRRVPRPYFNAFSAVSQGESHARPNVTGDANTAPDRRVDIWKSFASELPPIPQAKAVPQVMRLVKRVFVDIKSSSTLDSMGGVDLNDFIDLAGDLISALTEGDVRGSENLPSRHYRSFDARYRINAVTIKKEHEYKVIFGGDLETFTTTFTYEWGPPRRLVTLTEGEEKSLLRRSRVERSPLLNPPPVENVKF